jgi:hypothetical protein
METVQITTESGNEALVSTTSIRATRDQNGTWVIQASDG